MNKKEIKEFEKMAKDHADFLCEKVFKPAFIMAFIHGAKHMDELHGLEVKQDVKIKLG